MAQKRLRDPKGGLQLKDGRAGRTEKLGSLMTDYFEDIPALMCPPLDFLLAEINTALF